MDEARAISLVVERIRSHRLDYPTQGLLAEAYEAGWCVYTPAVVEVDNPMAVSDVPRPSVFLVDSDSGTVHEIEDPDPETLAEACLWSTASRSPEQNRVASGLPPYPELWGPRRATGYDRQAVDALAQALARERDFAGWLARQLAELADLLGGSHSLVTRNTYSSDAEHVKALADSWLEVADGPSEEWRNWPAVDPAKLPQADTTGWLLTALEPVGDLLDSLDTVDLEAQTPAVMRLFRNGFEQFQTGQRWRACGIVEYYPALLALPPHTQFAADVDEAQRLARERQDSELALHDRPVLLTPSLDDPDVEALLRLAIDAEQRRSDVIDLDASAAAAYRRVLDRFGIPLDLFVAE